MYDDSKLLQRMEDLRMGVALIAGHLGHTGFGDSVGMAVRLRMSHDELILIRTHVTNVAYGVVAIAIATVASVWHHW